MGGLKRIDKDRACPRARVNNRTIAVAVSRGKVRVKPAKTDLALGFVTRTAGLEGSLEWNRKGERRGAWTPANSWTSRGG